MPVLGEICQNTRRQQQQPRNNLPVKNQVRYILTDLIVKTLSIVGLGRIS